MLGEADFGMTQQAHEASKNRFHADDKLYVQFYIHARADSAKSTAEGRPIFNDTEYVRIMVPGDKGSIIERPVRPVDTQRFPRQYQAFKNNDDEVLTGTPLEHWPGISRSQVEELKFFHIRTVEQLADVPDSHAQKFMGINALKSRAQAYIELAKGNAPLEQMQAELEERDLTIATMQETMAALQERLLALEE